MEDEANVIKTITSPSPVTPKQHLAGSDFTINSEYSLAPSVVTKNGKQDLFVSRDPNIYHLFHLIINGKVLHYLIFSLLILLIRKTL